PRGRRSLHRRGSRRPEAGPPSAAARRAGPGRGGGSSCPRGPAWRQPTADRIGFPQMDARELRPGLWRWTAAHPEWEEGLHWPQEVGSVYAELPEALAVIDPQVPTDATEDFWAALDRDVERLGRPVHVLLTVHWHERSVEA